MKVLASFGTEIPLEATKVFSILAFLFMLGSLLGWVLELFFRRFISGNNPDRKWINPGFMVGPYVPLYGTGLCILYLVSRLSESRQIANPVWNHIAMLVLMFVFDWRMGCACLLAAVVAVTRVLTGVHYPSDVLAGLAFGAGAAVIGFLL